MPPSQPLLDLLFGAAASEILTISPRLELWSNAFSAWIEWIHSTRGAESRQRALKAWRSLIEFQRCPPWEIKRGKIEGWLNYLLSLGLSESTANYRRGSISSFYLYSNRNRLLETDPLFSEGGEKFNPARDTFHSGNVNQLGRPYKAAFIMRPFEARALLRAIDRPSSIFGKRDYAFLLTLLLTGLDEGRFRLIQWGSVRQSPQGVELLLPDTTHNNTTHPLLAYPLPQPAWDAILDYLTASGRLPGMKAEDYIFCPLANPVLHLAADSPGEKQRRANADWSRRQDWLNDRPISTSQLYILLTTYASWAGLDTRYVTFASLRHASSVFLLQAGWDDLDLQSFQGRSSLKETRFYIYCLGKMLAHRGKRSPNPALSGRIILPTARLSEPLQEEKVVRAYARKKVGAQPGNIHGLKHGFHYDGLLPGDRELLQFLFEDEKAIAQKGALALMMEFLKEKVDPSVEIPAELQQKDEIKKMSQALDDPDMVKAEIIRLRLLFYRALRLTKETDNLPTMLRAVNQGGLAVGKIIKLRRRLYPALYPRPKPKHQQRRSSKRRRR